MNRLKFISIFKSSFIVFLLGLAISVKAVTSSVAYNFNSDQIGTSPAGVTSVTPASTMVVESSSLLNSNVVKVTDYGSNPPAIFSFDNFPTSDYQQIVWKNVYTNSVFRGGFILRGSADQNGFVNGYLFQVNPALTNGKILKLTNTGNILLATYTFSGQGPNTARYYRATANGNTLTFERSSNGTTWVLLGTLTDSTYTSGGVYYGEGYGSGTGQSVAGNTYNDDITYTYESGPVIVNPPSAPQNLNVTNATPTSVSFSWEAPLSNGGSEVLDYEIEYKQSSSGSWSSFDDGSSNTTTVTISSLVSNTDYDFRVRAKNSAGVGDFSSILTTTTPDILVTGTITLTSPVNYQVFQRDENNLADIEIEGTYTGGPVSAIEARFGNGPWTVIDPNPNNGNFSGVLVDQTAGQGDVSVRFNTNVNILATKNYIGVGDIYVVAGQSNASGRGKTNQVYSHATLKASLFGNDDVWKELKDPHDKNINQVDVVSSDPLAKGSFVPILATHFLADQNIPIAFIPASMGATSIDVWGPTSELYLSMKRRVDAVGGKIKAVLWFQGESDSSVAAVVGYVDQLNELVDSIYTDFGGAKTVIGMLGSATPTGEGRSLVRMAQKEVIETNPHAVQGPAMYDVNIDNEGCDGTHFCSDADLAIFGERWWRALDKEFYGGSDGFGPQLVESTLYYSKPENAVYVEFSDDSLPIIAPPFITNNSVFKVLNGTSNRAISSINYINDNIIKLNLSSAVYNTNPVYVSYAVDNRSGILNAVYDSLGMPAMNFKNEVAQFRDVPSVPLNLQATIVDASSVGLTWNPPASNGNSEIFDYEVEYKLSSEQNWSIFADGQSTNTETTIDNLSPGGSYNLRVRAINSLGGSSYVQISNILI